MSESDSYHWDTRLWQASSSLGDAAGQGCSVPTGSKAPTAGMAVEKARTLDPVNQERRRTGCGEMEWSHPDDRRRNARTSRLNWSAPSTLHR